MKILKTESRPVLTEMRLRDDGSVTFNDYQNEVLRADGERGDGVWGIEDIKAARAFLDEHWPKLRPLAENEHRDADGDVRAWSWANDEPRSRKLDNGSVFTLNDWYRASSAWAKEIFAFGLTWAHKTCPPHLAVLDDGMVYEMKGDEARGPSGQVRRCSLLARREDSGDALPPGQRERVEAWRERQKRNTETGPTLTDEFETRTVDTRILEHPKFENLSDEVLSNFLDVTTKYPECFRSELIERLNREVERRNEKMRKAEDSMATLGQAAAVRLARIYDGVSESVATATDEELKAESTPEELSETEQRVRKMMTRKLPFLAMSPEVATEFQHKLDEVVRERVKYINQNRERLLEAFVAETGLHPSDCCMVERCLEDGRIEISFKRSSEV